MRRFALLIVLLLVLSLPAGVVKAQCPCQGHTVVILAPAVSKAANGQFVGVVTKFVITVAPGSGHVYIETWPLAQVDMQASARLAAQMAGKILGVNMSRYDVFIQVRANAPIIGGPSAGGTMTVGIIAALKGWKLKPDVMMTGMINPDGTIGPVGGILEKASAAAEAGMKIFLIPQGQQVQMVQETRERSIGGITEITSVTKRVNVTAYAAQRWGLKVIPISTIYQAVYYFTGHKLPQPKVPSNLNINTDFLRPYALADYSNTSSYYSEVLKELKRSNVGYNTYILLMQAMNQAKQLIKEANADIEQGMYYTALSRDFQARIIVRHVQWYMNVTTDQQLRNLLRRVHRYINSTDEWISNLTIKGYTMLQAVAAAEERIEDAKSALQSAWKYYYNNDYWDSISQAAYAYERAKTAVFWAKLGEKYASGEVIPRSSLNITARSYIDDSELIVTYIESMYGNVLGNDLLNIIDKARQYYADGKYSAAIFTAMEARVRGEVFLDTVGITNTTILLEKMDEMKKEAKVAIGLAEERGAKPILSIAYYAFAEAYQRNVTSISDITMAMIFYQYARETAQVFLMKQSWGNHTSSEVMSTQTAGSSSTHTPPASSSTVTSGHSSSATETQTGTSTGTPLSNAGIVAALIGLFIAGLLIGWRIRL
ncbi:MAG: ATP-dependent protease [Thermococci archaeon]|nr:ATP-dependent protease [Thermococci archaeon]